MIAQLPRLAPPFGQNLAAPDARPQARDPATRCYIQIVHAKAEGKAPSTAESEESPAVLKARASRGEGEVAPMRVEKPYSYRS